MKSVILVVCSVLVISSQVEGKTDCTTIPEILEEDCCIIPDMLETEIDQLCEKEANSRKLMANTKDCYMTECYYRKLNVMDGNKLSASKLENYTLTQTELDDEEWKTLIVAAIPECIEKAYKNENEIKAQYARILKVDPNLCNPIFDYINDCVIVDLTRNCPESAWTNSKACDNFKSFIDECPDYLLTVQY